MTQQVYKDMVEVMKRRKGPYAGLDIPEFHTLMEELFTPEEAEVNNALPRKPATAEEIAGKMNRNEAEIAAILEDMADKGLCGTSRKDGICLYRGVPFMPGIFEYLFLPGGKTRQDRKIAKLIGAYKKAYIAKKGVAKIAFPVTRVIPVHKTIRALNTIHTYDQVTTYIEKYDTICVGTCYCRQSAKLRGENIRGLPLEVCMWFGQAAEHMIERRNGRRLSKQEAMEILDETEEAGLIHMSRNTTEEIEFLCNCDRWHCEVVSEVLKQPQPGRVFNSGFQPVLDPEECLDCETCMWYCPSEALTSDGDGMDAPELNPDRCFGCGLCASMCPGDAIQMVTKPGFQAPPKDVRELVAGLKASAAG